MNRVGNTHSCTVFFISQTSFKNNIEVYADGEMNTIITAIQDKYINGILAMKDGSDRYIFGHFIDTSLSYCITDNEILSLNVR